MKGSLIKELTFGELKQGLLCCTVYHNCRGCPLFDESKMQTHSIKTGSYTMHLMTAAMNCINIMEKDLYEENKRADAWEQLAHEQDEKLFYK